MLQLIQLEKETEMAVAVTLIKTRLLSTAGAVALTLPLWAGASLAQDAQAQTQGAEQADQAQQSSDPGPATNGQQAQGQVSGPDALFATVGDAEIHNSDVMQAIGAFPPPLNAQPPEMLVPMAVQQLLLREAIVQEARAQGLGEDPEVQSLVEGATQAAEEDALVQVWLQRELQGRVTPEAVDQAYASLQALAGDQPVPELEQIRPQIEQSLAQLAFNDIQSALLANANIILYGPDRQPIDQQPVEGQNATGGQASGGGTGDQSGDTAGGGQDPSQGNAASGDAASGDQGATGEQATEGN